MCCSPLAGLVLVLVLAAPARADELSLRPSYDLATDVAVTAVSAGATLTLTGLKKQLAPPAEPRRRYSSHQR